MSSGHTNDPRPRCVEDALNRTSDPLFTSNKSERRACSWSKTEYGRAWFSARPCVEKGHVLFVFPCLFFTAPAVVLLRVYANPALRLFLRGTFAMRWFDH